MEHRDDLPDDSVVWAIKDWVTIYYTACRNLNASASKFATYKINPFEVDYQKDTVHIHLVYDNEYGILTEYEEESTANNFKVKIRYE